MKKKGKISFAFEHEMGDGVLYTIQKRTRVCVFGHVQSMSIPIETENQKFA